MLVFDFTSFLTGVLGGAVGGILATMLYRTESMAELQDRVRSAIRELDMTRDQLRDLRAKSFNPSEIPRDEELRRVEELRAQLASLNEEIKRLYRRSGR